VWAEAQIGLPWLFAAMGDEIHGTLGNDARSAAIGKDINQDNRDYRNPVNVYNQFGDEGGPRNQIRPEYDRVPISQHDIVERLSLHMFGTEDGYVPGVLRNQARIIEQQSEMLARMASMMFWLYTVTAVLIILVVLAIVSIFTQ
jgi:hypothetical protein